MGSPTAPHHFLRALRAMPNPCAGRIRGVVHCLGPIAWNLIGCMSCTEVTSGMFCREDMLRVGPRAVQMLVVPLLRWLCVCNPEFRWYLWRGIPRKDPKPDEVQCKFRIWLIARARDVVNIALSRTGAHERGLLLPLLLFAIIAISC
jgi:hypothetical protein